MQITGEGLPWVWDDKELKSGCSLLSQGYPALNELDKDVLLGYGDSV